MNAARRLSVVLLAASIPLLATHLSRAQASGDAAAAQGLFDQAVKLVAQERYTEACPKFAESAKLDPGIGTLLYLADCYEHIGRTASAWANFREAEFLAGRTKDARENIARQRAEALESRVSRLTIRVPPASAVAGLEVREDGELVGQGSLNTAVPTDPGKHTIAATAPGKTRWLGHVDLAASGASATIEVPPLADAPPESREAVRIDTSGESRRLIGIAVAAGGLVGITVGTFFGLSAKSKYDDSNGHCLPNNHCDATGTDDRHVAFDYATVSTISFIVGGLAVAAGGFLYFTAPKVAITPSTSGRDVGLSVTTRW